MIKELFGRRKKSSMFEQSKESELLNVFISFLVASSLIVFPFPKLGLIAVAAWGIFFVVAFLRKYNYLSISIIGFVFLAITVYQTGVTIDYIQDQRLYGNLIEVTPEARQEYVDSMNIQIDVTNSNVDVIDYQFTESMNTDPNMWSRMDESGSIPFEGFKRGSYYLALRIFYKEGDAFMTIEYYGRYAISGD